MAINLVFILVREIMKLGFFAGLQDSEVIVRKLASFCYLRLVDPSGLRNCF